MKYNRLAFVYPGQGSQYVGMGTDLADASPEVAQLFDRANETLGRNITRVMHDGPEDELRQTINTQPALFLHAAAMDMLLKSRGYTPIAVAGHSLGEYTGLYSAEVVGFGHALWLVKTRGELMQKAEAGTMAAILGLDDTKLQELCAASGGRIVVANYNAPGQIVISGEADAMPAFLEQCKAAGAKRALPLPVSGAFHSPLMGPASNALGTFVDKTAFHHAQIPVVMNVDGQAHTAAEEIRECLRQQMTSSVQWTKTVETLIDLGVDGIVEVGPGKVLAGLIKRIAKDMPVWSVGNMADLEAFEKEMA